jgi:hypothetical protein
VPDANNTNLKSKNCLKCKFVNKCSGCLHGKLALDWKKVFEMPWTYLLKNAFCAQNTNYKHLEIIYMEEWSPYLASLM